jgi:flagellar basal-body rod protein FlgF
MNRAIFPSVAGATAAWSQMEVVANNLSNTSTVGYKASRIAFTVDGPDTGPLGQAYTQATQAYHDSTDGTVRTTGNPLDFALRGEGWFVVRGGDGGERLTRDGRFTMNPDGQVVTANGDALMGQGGPVTLQQGDTLTVDSQGRMFVTNDLFRASGPPQEVDRLKIVSANAKPSGDNLWTATGPITELLTPSVVQGSVEESNVNPMQMMVELVQASRSFEAFQKAIQAADDLDARLNRLGGA